ncbi:hypothetical protein LXL04_023478 [Taraxacum kok-saghyz]
MPRSKSALMSNHVCNDLINVAFNKQFTSRTWKLKEQILKLEHLVNHCQSTSSKSSFHSCPNFQLAPIEVGRDIVNHLGYLERKQFPVRLCFAMIINKAQGQTIPYVGIYLPEPVFSHDQIYVALSRGISRANTKVLVLSDEKSTSDEVYTSNLVYREVLSD